MLTLRFDDDAEFFTWLASRAEVPDRFHLMYPVGDPATGYIIYPIALDPAGIWVAVCDDALDSEDGRWQASTRIGGWQS